MRLEHNLHSKGSASAFDMLRRVLQVWQDKELASLRVFLTLCLFCSRSPSSLECSFYYPVWVSIGLKGFPEVSAFEADRLVVTDLVSFLSEALDDSILDPGVVVRAEIDIPVGMCGLSVYAGGDGVSLPF